MTDGEVWTYTALHAHFFSVAGRIAHSTFGSRACVNMCEHSLAVLLLYLQCTPSFCLYGDSSRVLFSLSSSCALWQFFLQGPWAHVCAVSPFDVTGVTRCAKQASCLVTAIELHSPLSHRQLIVVPNILDVSRRQLVAEPKSFDVLCRQLEWPDMSMLCALKKGSSSSHRVALLCASQSTFFLLLHHLHRHFRHFPGCAGQDLVLTLEAHLRRFADYLAEWLTTQQPHHLKNSEMKEQCQKPRRSRGSSRWRCETRFRLFLSFF